MNIQEVEYLINKANQIGRNGEIVVGIVLPTSATQNISDTIFIVTKKEVKSATEGD